jgi:phosphotransacetylase
VRAALHCIGSGEGLKTVSSAFIMVHDDPQWGSDGVMVFSDCAVMPDPNPEQLAEIAISAASTFRSIVGGDPRVAMLSFSTKGSADHPLVSKVVDAIAELDRRGVDFEFDGELQLDAALIQSVGDSKAPGSAVAGRANVLVFPDLNAGNITYKAVERLAGARAPAAPRRTSFRRVCSACCRRGGRRHAGSGHRFRRARARDRSRRASITGGEFGIRRSRQPRNRAGGGSSPGLGE